MGSDVLLLNADVGTWLFFCGLRNENALDETWPECNTLWFNYLFTPFLPLLFILS